MADELAQLEVQVFKGRRATVVKVIDHIDGELLATGESVCHPDDKYDRDIGYELAAGRALQSLSNRLVKSANGRVKQVDNDRMQRQAAADKHNLEELVELPAKPNKKRGPKLNKEIAEEIRYLWRVGHTTQSLSDDFGVSEKSIMNIIQNKTYT